MMYEIERLGDIAVVVRDGNKEPVAFGGIWLKSGELCGVYVSPEHRGKGLEKFILARLTHVATVHKIPRLHMKIRWTAPFIAAWLLRAGKPFHIRHFHWFEVDTQDMTAFLTRRVKIR